MPTHNSTSTEVQLYALLLESIFWGLHIVSLCFCLSVLLRTRNQWRRRPEISKVMLAVVLLMACIGTFDTFLTFAQSLKALVYYDGPEGPDAVYNDTSGWMHLLGVVDVILQMAIGDIMVIYRCWIVHGRSWLAISLPVFLGVCGFVLIVCLVYFESILPNGSQFDTPYRQLKISALVVTIAINVITTSLILYRIWRVDRLNMQVLSISSAGAGRNTYRNAQRMIIESGLMSTIVTAITVVAYVSGSPAFSPLTAIDVNMIPIAFNLMLIRVYRNREHEAEEMYANANPHTHTGRVRSSLRFAPAVSSVDDSSGSIATLGMDGDLEKQFVVDHSHSDGELEAGTLSGGTSTGTSTAFVPSSSQSVSVV
ncbi:hypothetical protein B0H13DRAFT_2274836 [Mycena leptocephala]|nr:hypothetical protein B0H13DRAFT_2274836 [Mycena leptocephala]